MWNVRNQNAETALAHIDTRYYTCWVLANSWVIGKVIAGNSRATEVWCYAPDVIGGHMSRGVTCGSTWAGVWLSAEARDYVRGNGGIGDAGNAEYSR